MSDAAANSDEQWLQFDFGVERHVDMIQLYAFNSPHGSDALASLSAVDVQVPDASADGGWRTVGRIRHLPPAPLVDGDDGVNVRRRGLPVYFVPLQHSGSATLQTADWLGFESAAVRLAHMANHRRGYAATALGLCHVAFWEEDPSTSLQLLGSAAVRARMLQLTPGASFAAHAAHADMYLPPTTGEAALDASLRDMVRLASATGEEGALRKDDRRAAATAATTATTATARSVSVTSTTRAAWRAWTSPRRRHRRSGSTAPRRAMMVMMRSRRLPRRSCSFSPR